METKDYLNTFYQNINEDSRLLTRYGRVEYLTTMRYIEKYLRPICASWRSAPPRVAIATL